ncbi:MAG: RluA family pseudouridine synthase, partial [Bacteroidota bacterium]
MFPHAPTKSAIKKAIKKGQITVNGQTATTATFIRGEEEISFLIPESNPQKKPFIFPLSILWEDAHLAIIHKPAGIVVSGNQFKTIANALPQNLDVSPCADACPPQPVHRLDYATTGLLLVGKTHSSVRTLNTMFAEKEIEKSYYAITIGAMKAKGSITSDVDEKASTSHFQVVNSIPSEKFGTLSLVKLNPQTGRRHQLRKHLSGIG